MINIQKIHNDYLQIVQNTYKPLEPLINEILQIVKDENIIMYSYSSLLATSIYPIKLIHKNTNFIKPFIEKYKQTRDYNVYPKESETSFNLMLDSQSVLKVFLTEYDFQTTKNKFGYTILKNPYFLTDIYYQYIIPTDYSEKLTQLMDVESYYLTKNNKNNNKHNNNKNKNNNKDNKNNNKNNTQQQIISDMFDKYLDNNPSVIVTGFYALNEFIKNTELKNRMRLNDNQLSKVDIYVPDVFTTLMKLKKRFPNIEYLDTKKIEDPLNYFGEVYTIKYNNREIMILYQMTEGMNLLNPSNVKFQMSNIHGILFSLLYQDLKNPKRNNMLIIKQLLQVLVKNADKLLDHNRDNMWKGFENKLFQRGLAQGFRERVLSYRL